MMATTTYIYRSDKDGFAFFAKRMRASEVFYLDPHEKDPLLWFAWSGSPFGPPEDEDYIVHGVRTKREMLAAVFEQTGRESSAGREIRLPDYVDEAMWERVMGDMTIEEALEEVFGKAAS